MDFLKNFVLFWFGLFLGIIYFSTVLLPLIYGLPKALYLAMRGELRWRAPLKQAFAACAWFVGFGLAIFALLAFVPDLVKSIEDSGSRALGSILGVAVCLWRTAMIPSAQEDMAADFDRFTSNDIKTEKFDKNKSASMQASLQSYKNLVFSAIIFTFIVIINQWLEYSAVKYISLIVIYLFTITNIIELFIKLFAVFLSLSMNFVDLYKKMFDKEYSSWRMKAGGNDYPGIPETIVGVFILAMNLATLYMAYIALNTLSPDEWNIYHSFGL